MKRETKKDRPRIAELSPIQFGARGRSIYLLPCAIQRVNFFGPEKLGAFP
jgi:hypothetical protein